MSLLKVQNWLQWNSWLFTDLKSRKAERTVFYLLFSPIESPDVRRVLVQTLAGIKEKIY